MINYTDCLSDAPAQCWAFGRYQADKVSEFKTWEVFQTYLVTPTGEQAGGIFGFAEFIQAFAVLVLIYTLSDVRYRFRIAAAWLPVRSLTFWLTLFIGVSALVSDYWFTNKLPLPTVFPSRAIIQTVLASLFLIIIFMWLWFAFLRPPVFSSWNAYHFFIAIRNFLVEGSDQDLPTITSELRHSASNIVRYAPDIPKRRYPNDPRPEPAPRRISATSEYAEMICLIIGSRKIAHYIVKSSPITAIVLFDEMSKQKRYNIRMGEFASNVATEALLNTDSIIFHEDDQFSSGYLELTKPFTSAVFGDYKLVEGLAHSNIGSSLDISFNARFGGKFQAEQFNAYARGFLATLRDYLEEKRWDEHSYVIARAFDFLSHSVFDVEALNDAKSAYETDAYKRISVVLEFSDKLIELLEEKGIRHKKLKKRRDDPHWQHDLYDDAAKLWYSVIKAVSWIRRSDMTGWSVQYGLVWNKIAGYDASSARSIVLFKLRRLIYDDLRRFGWLDFQSASVLGFCLNVLGLQKEGNRTGREKQERALRTIVQSFARNNFLREYDRNPEVASNVLAGSITFDKKNKRLVKTYMKGLDRTAPQDFLPLKPSRARRQIRTRRKKNTSTR
jgi:hypothetical protein